MTNVSRIGLLGLALLQPGCFFLFDVTGPPGTTDTGPEPEDSGRDPIPTDTAPPPDRCYQQEAAEAGLVDFTVTDVTLDPSTLAALTELPPPTAPVPGGLQDERYHGAIDPDAESPWWGGWTYLDPSVSGGLPGPDFHPLRDEIESGAITPATSHRCAEWGFEDAGRTAMFGAVFPVCAITTAITADTTLPPDHLYVLMTDVRVGNGDTSVAENPEPDRVVLTLRAGTQLFGMANSVSALVVTRNSRLRARGTADKPVIMGAVEVQPGSPDLIVGNPADLSNRGQWIGLTLSGWGLVSNATVLGEVLAEQTQFGPRWFGGTVDADRSGDIDHLVLAEAGIANWRGALRLEGAGRGTTLDHVQILGSEDHCVETIGGAAFLRHVVCSGAQFDGLHQERGYTGEVQWGLVVFGPTRGFTGLYGEASPGVFDTPMTAPKMANLTIIGNIGTSFNQSIGAHHTVGWRGQVHRSVITEVVPRGLEQGCLDIDDSLHTTLRWVEAVFACAQGPLAVCDD